MQRGFIGGAENAGVEKAAPSSRGGRSGVRRRNGTC